MGKGLGRNNFEKLCVQSLERSIVEYRERVCSIFTRDSSLIFLHRRQVFIRFKPHSPYPCKLITFFHSVRQRGTRLARDYCTTPMTWNSYSKDNFLEWRRVNSFLENKDMTIYSSFCNKISRFIATLNSYSNCWSHYKPLMKQIGDRFRGCNGGIKPQKKSGSVPEKLGCGCSEP